MDVADLPGRLQAVRVCERSASCELLWSYLETRDKENLALFWKSLTAVIKVLFWTPHCLLSLC